MNALKVAIVMILIINGGYSLINWMIGPNDNQRFNQQEDYSKASAIAESQADEGLSLPALVSLTKEIRSGQELERRLNEKSGINNLDLNGDEKVDYISVKEYGDVQNKIGYSLTVEPVKGEVQEVASVEIERNNDKAEIQVIGNEQIYGTEAVFNDWVPVERKQKSQEVTGAGGIPMYHSYFYPRPLWFSPFYFGFYPSYYSFFPIISRPVYLSRVNAVSTQTVRRGTNQYQSKSQKRITSPDRGKVAKKGISRSLKRPTSTQKQFRVTRKNNLRSGGFGRNGSRRFNSRSSQSRGVSRRSSFGGSRSGSSFGRSSFRSGGFSSRSFSFGGK